MLFRNDDIAVDSDVEQLKEIRSIFEKHGLKEHYSITPFGKTATLYDAYKPELTLKEIDDLTGCDRVTWNNDVYLFLRESVKNGHGIILHGHTHTRLYEYPDEEIRRRLKEGKELLEDAFHTEIKYYAPPFNSKCGSVPEIAKELGMETIGNEGDQFERFIVEDKPITTPFCWYHFWRFYRGDLSPEKLDRYLEKWKSNFVQ